MISDILPRYQEVANGSKKAFIVPFDTLDSSYINVYLNNTKQSSGYTISNKVVTFTSAPANGTVVTVTRVVPIEWEQEVLGAINQDSLNKIFTKLVAQMQTLKEEMSRAVKTDVTDTENGNDHFLELLEDAIDSLELANTKLEQVIASGTQALSDIDSAKTGALAQIESKVDEAEGWAETAEDWAQSVNPENFDHVKGKISNYILEIPQNLKLEISGNNVIAKAGTIIVDAGSTYKTVTYTQDTTYTKTWIANKRYVIFGSKAGTLYGTTIDECSSGDGSSIPSIGVYFNTSDKNFYLAGTYNQWIAYPVCLIDIDESGNIKGFTKFSDGRDCIFNGLGFIGQTKFIYPGFKVLEPIGYNSDGTLKSKEFTTNSLQLVTQGGTYNRKMYLDNNTLRITNNAWYYNKDTNFWYNQDNIPFSNGCIYLGDCYTVNDTVTNFTIRQPVRLATTEMLDKVQDQVDTKQDTLVSGTNIKTINSTSVLGSGNFTLADQSLSNLDSTGQMIVDSQNGTISNCILEIPQNIKVTLENNIVTLKAGSVLTGTGSTYNTVTAANDKTFDYLAYASSPGIYYLFTAFSSNPSKQGLIPISACSSGATLPGTGNVNNVFFNTTDKLIYIYQSDGWQQWPVAYPLAILNIEGGVISFAKDSNGNDMIFNGAGFMGHHAFVYPNVRKLICNGKTGGKLNSYDELVNGLYIVDLGQGVGTKAVISRNGNTYYGNLYWEVDKYSDLVVQAGIQYCRETNYCYSYNNGVFNEQSGLALIYITYNGTTVTNFTIRQPYEGARNLLTDDIEEQIDTKANDSDVLHKTGNETIADQKTFTGEIIRQMSSLNYGGIKVKNTAITKGTAPSTNAGGQFTFQDSTTGTGASSRVGGVEVVYNANGEIIAYLQAFKPEANSTDNVSIQVHYKADGTNYATAPTPTEDTTSSIQIDTVGARNTKLANYALDSNAVHRTSNETVYGTKLFKDSLYVDDNIYLVNNQNTYRHVYTDNSAITKGTTPSANTGTELILRDSNSVNIGSIAIWYNTSGTICTALRAYNPTAGTTDSAVIQVNYTADGKTYATAPTPALSDDSNKIATTEWFNDKLVLVNELPANPDSDVWYAIPEEE